MAALTATITDGIGTTDPGTAVGPVDLEPVGIEDSGVADMLAEFDAVGLLDSISTTSLAGQYIRSITDHVGLDDHGDGNAYQPDRQGITDTLTALVGGGRTITNPVGLTDAIVIQTTGTGTHVVNLTAPVGITDAIVVDRTVHVRQHPGHGQEHPPHAGGPFDRTPGPPYDPDRAMPPGFPYTPYRTGAS